MNDENIVLDENEIIAAEQAALPSGGEYGGENVQVLQDADHIRQRPGMYIGDTGTKGLHHLVYELVYNSVDEALAGYCQNIQVKIDVDGSVSVSDDGRGIPVEEHPEVKRSTLEVVLTTVGRRRQVRQGHLQGLGRPARHGRQGRHRPERVDRGRGAPQRPGLRAGVRARQGRSPRSRTSAPPRAPARKITFKPDPEIFHDVTLRLRHAGSAPARAGLPQQGPGDHSSPTSAPSKEETFKYDGGVAEFVEYLNRTEEVLHKPIYVEKTVDDVRVEVALQYTTGEEERVRCYANNAYNPAAART